MESDVCIYACNVGFTHAECVITGLNCVVKPENEIRGRWEKRSFTERLLTNTSCCIGIALHIGNCVDDRREIVGQRLSMVSLETVLRVRQIGADDVRGRS